jgi:anti-sigma factor RsiW
MGWNAAAILVLAFAATLLLQHYLRRSELVSTQETALVTEVFDQHVATLAAGTPPQVLSTDRHTVKPWFQGKIPFSFNLPENLPADTMLDGANLNYLDGQPVAQLLYSIGRHRVSVFVRQQDSLPPVNAFSTDHAGFHVMVFTAGDLAITAISDADSARLNQLASAIRQSQTANQQQRR